MTTTCCRQFFLLRSVLHIPANKPPPSSSSFQPPPLKIPTDCNYSLPLFFLLSHKLHPNPSSTKPPLFSLHKPTANRHQQPSSAGKSKLQQFRSPPPNSTHSPGMKSKKLASSHHKGTGIESKRSRAAPTAIETIDEHEFDSLTGEIIPTLGEPSSQPLELAFVEPNPNSGASTKRKRARIARGASTLRTPRSQLNGSLKFPTTLQSSGKEDQDRCF